MSMNRFAYQLIIHICLTYSSKLTCLADSISIRYCMYNGTLCWGNLLCYWRWPRVFRIVLIMIRKDKTTRPWRLRLLDLSSIRQIVIIVVVIIHHLICAPHGKSRASKILGIRLWKLLKVHVETAKLGKLALTKC